MSSPELLSVVSRTVRLPLDPPSFQVELRMLLEFDSYPPLGHRLGPHPGQFVIIATREGIANGSGFGGVACACTNSRRVKQAITIREAIKLPRVEASGFLIVFQQSIQKKPLTEFPLLSVA